MAEATGDKRQKIELPWLVQNYEGVTSNEETYYKKRCPRVTEEAVNHIMQHFSLSIAGDVSDEDGPIFLLEWLKSRYGDINRWDAERDYKDAKMVGIDAAIYLAKLDTALAMVKHSGVSTILNGCQQEFYKTLSKI